MSSITVKRGDYSIDVGSEAELRIVLKVLDERHAPQLREATVLDTPLPLRLGLAQGDIAERPVEVTPVLLQRVSRETTDRGRKFLRFVASKGEDGAADREIREALGFRDNTDLAGTSSGLSKVAIRLRIPITAVLTKERRNIGGEQVWWYTVTPEMRETMM